MSCEVKIISTFLSKMLEMSALFCLHDCCTISQAFLQLISFVLFPRSCLTGSLPAWRRKALKTNILLFLSAVLRTGKRVEVNIWLLWYHVSPSSAVLSAIDHDCEGHHTSPGVLQLVFATKSMFMQVRFLHKGLCLECCRWQRGHQPLKNSPCCHPLYIG